MPSPLRLGRFTRSVRLISSCGTGFTLLTVRWMRFGSSHPLYAVFILSCLSDASLGRFPGRSSRLVTLLRLEAKFNSAAFNFSRVSCPGPHSIFRVALFTSLLRWEVEWARLLVRLGTLTLTSSSRCIVSDLSLSFPSAS